MSDKAPLLRAYNTALHAERHPLRFVEAHCRFISKQGWTEPPKAWQRVYDAHADRVTGCGSPAACDEALRLALKEAGHV